MDRRALMPFALRFAAAYAALGVLVVVCQRPLDAAVAPLVRLGLGVASNVEVQRVSSEGHRLNASVVVTRKEHGIRRRLKANVAANGDMMLVGPLLAVSAVAAWGYRSRRERAAGMALGTVFAVVLSAHDAASAIALGVESKVGAVDSVSGFYSFFLDSGGRQLLALGAAAAAIVVARRLDARSSRPSGQWLLAHVRKRRCAAGGGPLSVRAAGERRARSAVPRGTGHSSAVGLCGVNST